MHGIATRQSPVVSPTRQSPVVSPTPDFLSQAKDMKISDFVKSKNSKDNDCVKQNIQLKDIDLTNYDKEFKKDCKGYEIVPTILPKANRIIVVGDTHGDYNMTIKSLRMGKIINKNLEWIAEPDTIVIQVGDQIDRCRPFKYDCDDQRGTFEDEASDIKIMKFMTELDKQAQAHQCRVISLLGNHEIMNSQGNMTYVSYLGRKEFNDYKDPKTNEIIENGTDARIHAFKPGNEYANFMACTRISCVIIGSNIFVHAAIIPKLIQKYKIKTLQGLEGINTLVRKWLLGQINADLISDVLNSETVSPFWPRILGYIEPNQNKDNEMCQEFLNPILKTLNLGNIIVGHTPQFYAHSEGINSTCDNKLWRVDIGASKAFHPFDKITQLNPELITEERRIQVLEILNDTEFNIIKDQRNEERFFRKYKKKIII
jgi:hypothetical protein